MTRHERKQARNPRFAQLESIKQAATIAAKQREDAELQRLAEYLATHPVSTGIIPLVDYAPPVGNYCRA